MDVTKKSCFVVNYTKVPTHHTLWDLPFGKWKLLKVSLGLSFLKVGVAMDFSSRFFQAKKEKKMENKKRKKI
jgi:hypothetical protein